MFQQALLEINNRLEKISGLVLANLNSGEGITAEDGARVGLNGEVGAAGIKLWVYEEKYPLPVNGPTAGGSGCDWDQIGCESKKILFR